MGDRNPVRHALTPNQAGGSIAVPRFLGLFFVR